jgi:uncharacterized protein
MNMNKMAKDEKIIEEIKKFVEEECKKPTSKYGDELYIFHFIPMHNYAMILAERLKADMEIVDLAAWLHDIGSIIHGREDHHITGAEIAEKRLRELNYPEERIQLVKRCILNHRGSVLMKKQTKEEQIIADADAISIFDNIGGIYKAAFTYENKNQEQGNKAVRQKLMNSFNKVSPEAKEIIRPKYDAAMLLLGT